MRWALLSVALLSVALLSCAQKGAEGETWVEPLEVPAVAANQHGKVALLALGYGSCTEVCPVTLSRLAAVHTLMGEKADQAALLYVSVDPEHDDVEHLREKVRAHSEAIEAIALQREQLTPLLAALDVEVRKRLPDAKGNYGMDHPTELFALDRSGRLRVRFGHEASAAQIVHGLNRLLEEDR